MYAVWFTGMKMTDESAEIGDWAESGWVDMEYSRREFWDEKPEPVLFDTREEAINYVEGEIGVIDTDDETNFYAVDMDTDFITGDWYEYHAVIEEM